MTTAAATISVSRVGPRGRFVLPTGRRRWCKLFLTAAASTSSSTLAFQSRAPNSVPKQFRFVPHISKQPAASAAAAAKYVCSRKSASIRYMTTDDTLSAENLSDEQVERITLDWVMRVVIGWNFCPFAEKPFRQGQLHTYVIRDHDEKSILAAVLGEMLVRKELPGTTLVVAPECFPNDFQSYLGLLNVLEEDYMEGHDLHGYVQVAPFHPRFEFEGSGEDGIDNYTNKAPFPMFHILRETEVARAVDKLQGDAEKVWRRNVLFLEDLHKAVGTDGVEKAVAGTATGDIKKRVDETVQRHRCKVSD